MDYTGHGLYRSWTIQVMDYTGHGLYRSWTIQVMDYTGHGLYRSWTIQVMDYTGHGLYRAATTIYILQYTISIIHMCSVHCTVYTIQFAVCTIEYYSI